MQETVARTLAARHRLDRRAVTPYALSVARNLAVSDHRRALLDEQHAPKLHVPDAVVDDPAVLAERRAEAAALSAALSSLSDFDRQLVCSKEVDGRGLGALAAEFGSTEAALAARMARLRARLRVDYVTNLRRLTLPTEQCRPVLLNLSGGQQRRRRAPRTKEHLDSCATCAELAPLVESRRRPVAALVPLPFLLAWQWLRGAWLKHPWQFAGSTGAAVATSVAVVVVALHHPQPPAHRAAPAAATATTTAKVPVRSDLVSVHARVLSVPADEGFWIADRPAGRLWVQMTGAGESPQQIRVGEVVTFVGRRVAHRPGFARSMGLAPGADATALDRAGVHLEVPHSQVRLSRS